MFGGLNEVVDPKVIDRATFITGGFPAEYGGQMAAIIDLNNRVPTGSPTKRGSLPSWIFNLGVGHTLHMGGGATFEPSLYITTLLDHEHLIKGAYFSGASWEEPRNVILRLAVYI